MNATVRFSPARMFLPNASLLMLERKVFEWSMEAGKHQRDDFMIQMKHLA